MVLASSVVRADSQDGDFFAAAAASFKAAGEDQALDESGCGEKWRKAFEVGAAEALSGASYLATHKSVFKEDQVACNPYRAEARDLLFSPFELSASDLAVAKKKNLGKPPGIPALVDPGNDPIASMQAGRAKLFCCLHGFQAGSKHLEDSIKTYKFHSPPNESDITAMLCKSDYTNGMQVAENACNQECRDEATVAFPDRPGCFGQGFTRIVMACDWYKKFCIEHHTMGVFLNLDKKVPAKPSLLQQNGAGSAGNAGK